MMTDERSETGIFKYGAGLQEPPEDGFHKGGNSGFATAAFVIG
jgi:hypothetical protein